MKYDHFYSYFSLPIPQQISLKFYYFTFNNLIISLVLSICVDMCGAIYWNMRTLPTETTKRECFFLQQLSTVNSSSVKGRAWSLCTLSA